MQGEFQGKIEMRDKHGGLHTYAWTVVRTERKDKRNLKGGHIATLVLCEDGLVILDYQDGGYKMRLMIPFTYENILAHSRRKAIADMLEQLYD